MDDEATSYRETLLSEIRVDALTGGDYERTRFVDRACQVLESAEVVMDYSLCQAKAQWKRGGVVQVDAYSISASDGVLTLIIGDYSGAVVPEPITTDDVRESLGAAERFVKGSIHSDVAQCWDESHPAHALAREIFEFSKEDMTKVTIILISDRELGQRFGRMPELSMGAAKIELQIWDIARLARSEASTIGREQIEVDLALEYGQPVSILPADLGDSDYRSYMCVMPGSLLASLYDKHGGRILEQNVRAFLGEGRKVNRGIRLTLRERPEMLFAFNNGITATASEIEIDTTTNPHRISKVTGFQIVNGGQTTASLYWAQRAKLDLSRAFVQMKLSVLKDEGFEEAVHDIATYANAQNPVSASDLFAGSPFFKRLETLSRQQLAPAAKAGDVGSYWYFERTQGSYGVELKRYRGVAAKTWQMLRPKKQRLTKTDVARYEATWGGLPHSVCSGQQKNIAAFGKIVDTRWKQNPETCDATYFKDLVARAILTQAVDAAIPAQPWYPGSILRQLTTYSISLICDRMAVAGLKPDFETVWKSQRASPDFVREAVSAAEHALPLLMNIPEEQTRNRLVGEWAKKEACWIRVRESSYALSEQFRKSLVSTDGKDTRRMPWPIKARVLWSNGAWKRLKQWNAGTRVLTDGENDVVELAAMTCEFNFKGYRLTKLSEAWNNAVQNGFV